MSRTVSFVFVYGTLKKNQPNHYWLTNSENGISRLVGKGTTKDIYPLVIGTRYNIPYLLNVPGVGNQVRGEIYEVDELMLSKLDELECHPTYYLRQQIPINDDNGTNQQLCWTYFLKNYPEDFLQDRQLISSYEDSAELGYVKPSERGSFKALDDLHYRSK